MHILRYNRAFLEHSSQPPTSKKPQLFRVQNHLYRDHKLWFWLAFVFPQMHLESCVFIYSYKCSQTAANGQGNCVTQFNEEINVLFRLWETGWIKFPPLSPEHTLAYFTYCQVVCRSNFYHPGSFHCIFPNPPQPSKSDAHNEQWISFPWDLAKFTLLWHDHSSLGIMYQVTTTADQRWSCDRGGNEGHSLCWLEKSPSLMVCGCSSSPTGAVMLTLNFCSPAHTSKDAGCVVSLKLMPIRTEVDAPTPKEATEWKRAEQNQIKLSNISFTPSGYEQQ